MEDGPNCLVRSIALLAESGTTKLCSGLFRLDIDEATGRVKEVRVLKSTGHKILDDAGIKAFRQWRFKPHTIDKVKIPLALGLTGFIEVELGRAQKLVTHAVRPNYPFRARWEGTRGRGVFQFIVDYDTGRVANVRVLQTTHSVMLDNAAVAALRNWRFKPRSVREVTAVVSFGVSAKTGF